MSREDKYNAKNFIDTVVYRSGDQIGAWSSPALAWLGLGLTGVSFVAAPVGAVRLVVSLWLGRKQSAMANAAQPGTGSAVRCAEGPVPSLR